MKQEIINKLKQIEEQKNIKILLAIESGSRAWNFASEDSDYDIRGIYIQDYNRVEGIEEQIDCMDEKIDICLWDLKKFLSLMKKSNPSCWEWLSSDIVYIDNNIKEKLTKLFCEMCNKDKLRYHYISMAKQNFHKYIVLLRDNEEASYKKYIYTLRCIACCLYLEKTQRLPPKDYKKVIYLLPKKVKDFLNKIIKEKIESEKVKGKRNLEVEKFIFEQLQKKIDIKEQEKFYDINKIFKEIIRTKEFDLIHQKLYALVGD